MTVETLDMANEILDKIKKLGEFKRVFDNNSSSNIIISQYYVFPTIGDAIEKDSRLNLVNFPDLQDFISRYLSDKITELESKLENL